MSTVSTWAGDVNQVPGKRANKFTACVQRFLYFRPLFTSKVATASIRRTIIFSARLQQLTHQTIKA